MGVLGALLAALIAAGSSDRAYDLVGVWSCESRVGSIGTHVIERNRDGSMTLHNDFHSAAGRHVVVDETYRFDSRKDRWRVTTAPDSWFGAVDATAPLWTDKTWTFEGTENTERAASPLAPRGVVGYRIVYSFPQKDRFERAMSLNASGQWDQPYSIETCVRTK